MTVKTYDPNAVILTIGNHVVSGFPEGSMIKAERNEDTYKYVAGCNGEGIRNKTANRSGKITVTLMQSSASNEFLSAMAYLDETGQAGAILAPRVAPTAGILPVTIKDGNGAAGQNTIWSATQAWVMKPASGDFEHEAKDREWVLEAHDLQYSERGF